MLSKSILVRLTLTVFLVTVLLLALGQSSTAATAYTFNVTGNSDQVVFNISPVPTFPIPVIWGVNNRPAVHQDLAFADHTLHVMPPLHTVSVFINLPGVVVSTDFTPLTSDGWYAVPMAYHSITITGDINEVIFKTNFVPREELSVLLGIPNQPAQRFVLNFADTTATLAPPPNTRSLLFNHHDIEVITSFDLIYSDGWYRLPLGQPILNHQVFLPITCN